MKDKPRAARFVDSPDALQPLLDKINGVGRIAVDIESNGMFAYRGRVCTVQVAWIDDGRTEVAIIDTLAVPVNGLAVLLESDNVIKVIHDLAFDARVLHLEGVDLRAVRDTSVAATYLGKPGTGLATLLANELDVHVGKEMQNSDWARRPLSSESLAYLAGDVRHLLTLDSLLTREVKEARIDDEVATETAYRLVDALETEPENRPPHVRIRGNERLDDVGRRVLASIARLRDEVAQRHNLPPQRIIGDKLLLAIADRRPKTIADLMRFRVLKRLSDSERQDILEAVQTAVAQGPDSTQPPPAPKRPPQRVIVTRKAIEKRLQSWRRSEAQRRQVNEQVVLPTHCIRRLVQSVADTTQAIASLPGLGPARAQRYASQLAGMIRDEAQRH